MQKVKADNIQFPYDIPGSAKETDNENSSMTDRRIDTFDTKIEFETDSKSPGIDGINVTDDTQSRNNSEDKVMASSARNKRLAKGYKGKDSFDVMNIKNRKFTGKFDKSDNRTMIDRQEGEEIYGDDKPLNRNISNRKGASLKEIKIGDRVLIASNVHIVESIKNNGIVARNFRTSFAEFIPGNIFIKVPGFNIKASNENELKEEQKEALYFQSKQEDESMFDMDDSTLPKSER